ncbi:MAG: 30S ribosomal protein S20 [Thermodesulfovibrionales bacterium]|nr:30S ribosomal protein S20 [Thermodesulfovibrionales bacterium]
MATKATTRKKKKLSVLKRARQAKKRELRNDSMKSKIKTEIKKLEALYSGQDREAIEKQLKYVIKTITSAASKGIIHKNTASRKVSRLTIKTNKALSGMTTVSESQPQNTSDNLQQSQ